MLISSYIESIFLSISASTVTEVFSWLLILVFILAVIFAALGKGRSFTAYAPTLMTSIGILGTFVGIVIGLMHFDSTDIDTSIPILLGGLKTAFITSVCGLLGAVGFTSLNTILFAHRNQRKEERVEVATPEAIYSSLESQRKIAEKNAAALTQIQRGLTGDEEGSLIGQFKLLRADMSALSKLSELSKLEEHFNYQKEGTFAYMVNARHARLYDLTNSLKENSDVMLKRLAEMHKGLSGNEEGSLVGQLKLLRTHITDIGTQFSAFAEFFNVHTKEFDERLFKELAEFADMMSKAATETIIEALKDVIHDFNKNLTEQFGDNFKALDASVKKLVDWQEQYRIQVEQMGEQYQQSVESLMSTRESVAGIWQECQNIPQAMNELREIIDVNQHQIQELARHLEAFVAMRDKAVEAVPTIKEQVEQVTSNLVESSSNMRERLLGVSDVLLEGSKEMKESLLEGAEHFRDSVTTTQQSFNKLSNEVKNTAEEVSETLKDTTSSVNDHARNTLGTLQDVTKEVRDLASQVSNNSQQAVEDFKRNSEALNEELSRSLSASQSSFEGVMRQAAQSSGDTINEQLRLIEQATAREIQRAMQEMANQLTNITGRFVDDYQRMVEAMERVVNSVQ